MEDRQEIIENQDGEKGKKKKRGLTDNIIVIWLIATVLTLVGQMLGSFVFLIPFMSDTDFGLTISQYLIFGGVWIVFWLYLRLTKKNRPILQVLGRDPWGNRPVFLLAGMAAGFGLNGICILTAWLHGDIVLYYDSLHPVLLVLIFIAVLIQSSAEEFICRGFVFQRLLKGGRSPWVAIIGNAALFAILHLMNDGVTFLSILNILVIGIGFSLIVYYMDSLWCAIGLHTAWNFMQNIIFGLPNSGLVTPFSLFKLEASTAKNSFAYNVGFGVEGTVTANVLLIAVCILLYVRGRKQDRKPYVVWECADR
ncbi:MAG: CPBP family intramembrane metalloprotease [Lachnospiraceae bacterium]|nr:CPBP family intramembrane metalloprotease [Lachnospiraceae bacterium]